MKLLKRAERLEFLNFWVVESLVESLSFLACFWPSGPKLDSLVVTPAFAEVDFVEKSPGHARRASVARFARRFVQKCELFGFFGFRVRVNFLISEASRVGAFLILVSTSDPEFLNHKFLSPVVTCTDLGDPVRT